ncbi:MAG: hypothetical protein PHX51_08055 [Clostridia bacterium]|nr:hypothetical protein [Clostridia bacterium]
MKKILKGFKDLHYIPISANTATTYTPGTAVALAGAMSLSRSDTRNDVKIYADDGLYLSDSDFSEAKLDIEIAGISLADIAAFTGATYNSETSVLDELTTDSAPAVALSFAAALAEGEGYRAFCYYNCKCSGIKSDAKTAGQSTEASTVTVSFTCAGRLCDNKVRTSKDFDASTTRTSFLTTIAAVAPQP